MEESKQKRKRPKKISVKVVSAGKDTYWYANSIGKEFDVYANVVDKDRALDGTYYIDAVDFESGRELWHQFRPQDCEIIKLHPHD